MLKRSRCTLLLLLSLFVAVNAFCRNEAASSEFRDPTAAEKAMTSVDFAPGAAAVILNWHQIVDDRDSTRTDYFRIKILTEEGKKYGDVEVPHIALLSAATAAMGTAATSSRRKAARSFTSHPRDRKTTS